MERAPPPDDDPIPLPLDGTLDLHTFRPGEVKDLVPEWLAACQARGLLQVRIVHGKGSGALRRTVQALLARSPLVRAFRTADEAGGGWGATLVDLAQDPERQ
ncbi:MAG TPA: Smr/MutS family protein [Anaeromyxobacteraceae bacterium]